MQGSAGDEVGACMSGGTVIVRGHAGKRSGAGMSAGTVVVLGSVGSEPGVGMTGGRVVIAGSCPPPGEGAAMRGIETAEMTQLAEHLEPLGLTLEEDALVLVPSDSSSGTTEMPDSSIAEGFESIVLVPSTSDRLPEHSPLDPYTLLMPLGSKEGGLLFPIPWLVEIGRAHV